ncbi:MAG: aldo/keto reductase [Acidobacteriota bacterium]
MSKNNRRVFLKELTLGSFSIPFLTSGLFFSYPHRIKKGSMFYRRLGRTKLLVSEISLGGSPLPDWAIMMQAVEKGVNYIDTSHTYMNGNSERQIGKLLKEVGRKKIHVGTKFHLRSHWSEESIISSVEGSLQRLQTDYIDVLLIHGASDPKILTDERLLSAFHKMKKDGKFRFNGLSCHSNHHQVISEAVKCSQYDMVQLGYNVFDIESTEKDIKTYPDYLGTSGIRNLIKSAYENDIGVIAMKTLKVGGRRQNLDQYKTGTTSLYQAMLKWVLQNKQVTSVVTEMLNQNQLEEDLSVINGPLTEKERKNLIQYLAENSTDFCHMCGICQDNCPQGIETTSIMRYLAYFESYNKQKRAKTLYSRLPPKKTAKFCLECGTCDQCCPYQVSVRQRIHYADSLLS